VVAYISLRNGTSPKLEMLKLTAQALTLKKGSKSSDFSK
jgi:hypothetical protein